MNKITPSKYPLQQSIWRFCWLNIVTLGLYTVYWYYQNDKAFGLLKTKTKSFLKALGLFVPILGVILIWLQLVAIQQQLQAANIKLSWHPGWITACFVILAYISILPSIWALLLSLLAFLPFILIQESLSEYWKLQAKEYLIENRSGLDILLMVILSVIGALALLGIIDMIVVYIMLAQSVPI